MKSKQKKTKIKKNSPTAFYLSMARLFFRNDKDMKSPILVLQSITRTISAVLVVTVISTAFWGIQDTVAFYNDTEESENNTFVAGEVDFVATSSPWNPIETAISMAPGDSTGKTFGIDPLESNPFQYFASTTVSGDSDFCDGLQTTLSQDASTLYSGNLSGLLTATTTSLSELSLSATGATNNFVNKVCDFEISFNGWQTRHGFMSLGGYSDIEIATGTIASWGFRINKVYYDVAPDRGVEGDNEWVEIYNQTDTPLDLSGWKICNNNGCDPIPALTPFVPAMGYAWITNKPDTASATGTAPWYLPDGVVYIPLGNKIGGHGLANTADMLILKRPDGVIVDQMNWGTPNPAWPNYNDDVWNPGVANVAEGNVLARVPSGYDTNQPSDWKELKPPSVDLIYPDEDGSYTWYWTYSYTITWTATNPNGPDGNLNMSLFYIKDVNQDNIISLGDTTHTIISTTANDGAYDWTVPSGFTGYIWIKLVATGPENPFLNSFTVSGMIYDPIPLFISLFGVDSSEVDIEPPVITVNGNNPALISLGSVYSDLGAIVTDNVNENLGYETAGEVDTSTVGEYIITYTATDQMGNVGTATRTVIVYDPALGVPESEVQESSGGGAAVTVVETEIVAETETEEIVSENEEPTASVTEEIISTEENATTNPATTATTTPEIYTEEAEEETASTTPEVLLEEDTATSTEPTVEEDISGNAEVEEPEEEIVSPVEEAIFPDEEGGILSDQDSLENSEGEDADTQTETREEDIVTEEEII